MLWLPFIVSLAFFGLVISLWFVSASRIDGARSAIPNRVIVVGSRGKSGTVRLIDAALQNNGIPTYSKITGTVAQEITTKNEVIETPRLGPVSVAEMADTLLRASKEKAQAVVFECLAVSPKLIAFVQNKIVQASVVVLPTIRLDHLEDEGDTIAGITRNILSSIRQVEVLVTGEEDTEALKVIDHWAHQHRVTVIKVRAQATTPDIPGHHPTNIETACAVADHFGIRRDFAIQGMKFASTEPDAETAWGFTRGDSVIRYSDLGAANDPQSAAEAVSRATPIAVDATIVPIIVNRWDRPLRALAFAYALRANPNIPAVGIIGPAVPQIRLALRRQGFKSSQIKRIGFTSSFTQGRAIRKLLSLMEGHPSTWFVMLENIHAWPADRLRSAVQKNGQPIRVPQVRGEENDND